MATRYDQDQRTVTVKVDRRHWHGVGPNHPQVRPCFHFPYANRFIERTRNDEIRLRIEVDAEDKVGMTLEDLEAIERGAFIPYAEERSSETEQM